MPGTLTAATMLFAQSATAGTAAPSTATPASTSASVAAADLRTCNAANNDPNARQIIVCAPKPQGYRIDPDVLAARRLKKHGDPGAPRNPHETFVDHSCGTVGPMGCRGGPAIDVATAAMTAATMIDKAVKGEDVGKMWVTDPQRNEYQLYLEAKKAREAKEKEQAAKALQAREAAQGSGAVSVSTPSAGSR